MLDLDRICRRRDHQRIREETKIPGQNVPDRQNVRGGIQILCILVNDHLEFSDIPVVRRGMFHQFLIDIGEVAVNHFTAGFHPVPICGIFQRNAVLRHCRRFIQLVQSLRIFDNEGVLDQVVRIEAAGSRFGETADQNVHSI